MRSGYSAAEAESLPLTTGDPVALDWHNGRRTPDADPRVHGAIDGLTLATSAPAVFKALVEATAFGSRAINERMLEEGVPIDNIIAIGGIARKSSFVMRTMADAIRPVRWGRRCSRPLRRAFMGRLPKRSRLCAPVFRPNIVPIWNGMQFMIIFMRVIWNSEQRVE